MVYYEMLHVPQYNLLQKEACFHYVDMLFPMETSFLGG